MLWVNLIMDTFAALALATEPPPPTILQRQPYKKDNPIITPVMSRNVQGHAIYQSIILLVILFAGPSFLIDAPFELQCAKYDENGNCDIERLNPFFTKTEYYEPAIWELFTDKENKIDDVPLLQSKYKFDEHLLYKWRCNLFIQANWGYADRIEKIGLCRLDDAESTFLNPMKFSKWMEDSKLEKEDMEIIKEFTQSPWMLLNPALEHISIK